MGRARSLHTTSCSCDSTGAGLITALHEQYTGSCWPSSAESAAIKSAVSTLVRAGAMQSVEDDSAESIEVVENLLESFFMEVPLQYMPHGCFRHLHHVCCCVTRVSFCYSLGQLSLMAACGCLEPLACHPANSQADTGVTLHPFATHAVCKQTVRLTLATGAGGRGL